MAQILEHLSAGDTNSENVIVFLQGWPDNYRMWDWINWQEELAHNHLVFLNFPNTNGKVDHKWGKDFPQVIADLKLTLDSLQLGAKQKVLVAHDWGCFYGYMFDQQFPHYFTQIIAMDVPGKVELSSLKSVLYVIAYQWTLVFAFLIGGSVGKLITQALMGFFKHSPPYAQQVSSANNYPYYYLHRNKLLSKLGLSNTYLSGYRPSVPVVYLFGTKKPFQFHGAKWVKIVEESQGEVHALEAGHWFMKKYAKFITDLLSRRIKAKL